MSNIQKILFVSVIVLFISLLLFMDRKTPQVATKPSVTVSTFALYDIVQHVAGDSVDLFKILPWGVDAHDFELTPQLMVKISQSDLVIYSGAGLEPWVHGFNFKHAVIDMSSHVNLRALKHHDEDIDEDEHHHGAFDPHYWLSPSNMMMATDVITQSLITLNPSLKESYLSNKDEYLSMLKNLDKQFKTKLSTCKKDTIVVNHNAFGYIADKYNFHVASLSGFSSEAKPSAKDMTRLMNLIQKDKISTIFFESFASDRVIKSIAKDTHIHVDSLQPLANLTANEAQEKLTYEKIMSVNLEKIAKVLECR